MYMQNNKLCNGLVHVRVNFSQSEKSLLLRGRGFKILVTSGGGGGGGGVNTEDPRN